MRVTADLIPAGTKSLSALGSRATYEPEFAYYYKFRSLILDDPLGKEALELLLEFAQMPGVVAGAHFGQLTGVAPVSLQLALGQTNGQSGNAAVCWSANVVASRLHPT